MCLSSPSTSRAPADSDSGTGVLPPDVLFDVLLRLQARDLCRLRAVCRSWRSLTSDPLFVAAHAARHPGPLFLAKFHDDKTNAYVLDLSGSVVKRIAGAGGGPCHHLLCARLNFACLADWMRCSILNPATGALHALPESPAEEHVSRVNLRDPYTFFALGQVPSTGEHKMFRMFNRLGCHNRVQQLFEVLTISGGIGQARWRGQQNPGLFIDGCSGVVIDGVVYFLTDRGYDDVQCGIRPDYILSFDLAEEEWRRDLRGPISSNVAYKVVAFYKRHELALAELKGSLVLADAHRLFTMDLWFLVDFGSGLWVKQYRIDTALLNSRLADPHLKLKALLVLDDGRLIVYLPSKGLLFICDPGTSTFSQVDIKHLDSVGVYTGNLLSLGEGDIV